MDKTQFWQLIGTSRAGLTKKQGCDEQADNLKALLLELSAEEILQFDDIFFQLEAAAYRWDLWAICYIINGGASNDAFTYFCYWLISQGQNYYEAALENAENAASKVTTNSETECEMISYCVYRAYEEKTGAAIPNEPKTFKFPDEPSGERWDEEDLEELYPRLWAKFG